MATITAARLAELLANARKKNPLVAAALNKVSPESAVGIKGMEEATTEQIEEVVTEIVEESTQDTGVDASHGVGRDGSLITYNEKQAEAISRGGNGESIVLIGAAGTGKTTCQQGIARALSLSGKAGVLESDGHKYLPATGAPGIVVCAFTRRATNNIRRFMPDNMKANCITIHKLLEYEPVYYTVTDPTSGEERNTMRFEPARNRMHPLPASIRTVIFEESSMVEVPLHGQVQDALPHSPQYIYLGDIQQLPPVFGSSILGYKMLELPTIELTEVYRQALESPIIKLAHRILSGNPIPASEYPEWKVSGKLTLHPWKKKLSPDTALLTAAKFLTNGIEHGLYSPDDDMILIPFNKSFGTDELNKHIAQHIARRDQKIVYEIIAGFNKVYLSVGDKVLYDKEDAIVLEINRNAEYAGKKPQKESVHLDYWGHNQENSTGETPTESEMTEAEVDFLLEQAASLNEDRVKIASHIVRVRLLDSEREMDIDSAGAINQMILSYALTVHKSQGSEWRKVFLLFHQSHATMLQRELLYTAVTRAKEELYVICEPETFTNGIKSQRIKGNTLAEKAEFFKGKLEEKGEKLFASHSAMAKVIDKAEPYIERVKEKLSDCMELLASQTSLYNPMPYPILTFEKQGSSAGRAYYRENRININPIYLAQHPEETINQTVPHELAHLCSWHYHKQPGHEYWWQHYCKLFGIPPNQYHSHGRMGKNISEILKEGEEE
jgi:ATP-dependent exoDNAse (exonuclease V) alpha subunit/predicted SprT family Zn-dependent metalloprotease